MTKSLIADILNYRYTLWVLVLVRSITVIAVAGRESLKVDYTQDSKLGFVVNAIYTMAHALDSMYRDICGAKSPGLCDAMKPVNGSIFIRYLVNASFISYSGDYISFDAAGDPPARWTFTTAATASTFGFGFTGLLLRGLGRVEPGCIATRRSAGKP